MNEHKKNPLLGNASLPVDIVLHPSWWFHNTGITFDRDFFYHPVKRVEAERRMEQVLYERFGKYGLGENRDRDMPVVGPVHQAAGYFLSEMLGCSIEYKEDSAPQILPAHIDKLELHGQDPFKTPAWKRFEKLTEALRGKHGYLVGDVNWGGILNLAIDLRGQELFMDMLDSPDAVKVFFGNVAVVIEKVTAGIQRQTGTSSVSVNRNVRHFINPVFLHSECSHTMISEDDYRSTLMLFDVEWSRSRRPFGIHYCGNDPHRYAQAFSELPHLDFLDVGWGGDIAMLRKYLPDTFLNIRLGPVDLINMTVDEIRQTVTRLVGESGNPWLTGVCCINMDEKVSDEKICAIFDTVEELRSEAVAAGL